MNERQLWLIVIPPARAEVTGQRRKTKLSTIFSLRPSPRLSFQLRAAFRGLNPA